MTAQAASPDRSASVPNTPWMLGPWQDLLLFIATPVAIFPLFLLAHSRFSVDHLYLFVAAFGALGHHLPGMMRAYGDRALFRRFKTRFIVSPIFLVLVCVLFTVRDMSALMLVTYFWGIWHGMMQTYGFVRIYGAKKRFPDEITRRLDFLMCLSWFGAAVFLSPGRTWSILELFYKAGGPILAPESIWLFRQVVLIGTGLITLAFFANILVRWKQGTPPNVIKLLMMGISLTFWAACSMSFENLLIGILMFEVFHDVQYLSIVWIFNRKAVAHNRDAGPMTRFLFRPGAALIGAYIGLVFAYGSLKLFNDAFAPQTLQQVVTGVLTASALLHFYYDGFIWKMHDRDNREALGIREGQDGGARDSLRSSWLLAGGGWKWGFFVLPLVWLGYTQTTGMGKSDAARLEAIRDIDPDFYISRYARAKTAREEGDLATAETLLNQTIAGNPEYAPGYNELGLLFLQKQKPTRPDNTLNGPSPSMPITWMPISTSPTISMPKSAWTRRLPTIVAPLRSTRRMPSPTIISGRSIWAKASTSRPRTRFEDALAISPGSALALSGLARIEEQVGNLDAADSRYAQLLQHSPDNGQAHFKRAQIEMRRNDPQAALPHLNEAARLLPDQAEVQHALGLVYIAAGDTPKAAQHFGEALKRNPRFTESMNQMAALHHAHGRPDFAIKIYQRALAIDGSQPMVYFNLGTIFLEKQELEKAERHYRQALELAPDMAIAHNNLGLLLFGRKAYDAAKPISKKLWNSSRTMIRPART